MLNSFKRAGLGLIQVMMVALVFSIIVGIIYSLVLQYQKNLQRMMLIKTRDDIAESLQSNLILSVAAISYTNSKCNRVASDYSHYPQNPFFCLCLHEKKCFTTPVSGAPFVLYRSEPGVSVQGIAGGLPGYCNFGSTCSGQLELDAKNSLSFSPYLCSGVLGKTGCKNGLELHTKFGSFLYSSEVDLKMLFSKVWGTDEPDIVLMPQQMVRYSTRGDRCSYPGSTESVTSDSDKEYFKKCPFAADLRLQAECPANNPVCKPVPSQIRFCYRVYYDAEGGDWLAPVSNYKDNFSECTTLQEIMDRAAGKYSAGGNSSSTSSSPGSGSSSSGFGGSHPYTDSSSPGSDSSSSAVDISQASSDSSLAVLSVQSLSSSMPFSSGPPLGWGQGWKGGGVSTNGIVSAIALSGSTVYLGGRFTQLSFKGTRGGAFLDGTSGGSAAKVRGDINGAVLAAASDENGGFYIGGTFTQIGSVSRRSIAHILSSGEVDPNWNPEVIGGVFSLAVSGGIVYVGGQFTSIGGQPRKNIAAVDANGYVTTWQPEANGVVFALTVSGGTVYAGGAFRKIGGQDRNYIAALDSSGNATPTWNPNAQSVVYALAVSGGIIYAGGQFTSVGGSPSIGGMARNRIAALDANGNATPWNPNANNTVRAIAVTGGVVYAGGYFTQIGADVNDRNRNRIAALDASMGYATTWKPEANNTVLTLSVRDGVVYVGGDFTSIGGQSRSRIAALDAGGNATTWMPEAKGLAFTPTVRTLAVNGDVVYAGGNFTSIGNQTRNYLTALDASTGLVKNWNPNPNGDVSALVVSGNVVYVGGTFTSIGNQTRKNLVALDASTGLATSWSPNPNGSVLALAVTGDVIYAGGSFTSIGGQTRNRIAALNVSTGLATDWNPNASQALRYKRVKPNNRKIASEENPVAVHSLAVGGGVVYVGGFFTFIGGRLRQSLASLDASTGLATDWDPRVSAFLGTVDPADYWHLAMVDALAFSGETLYVGGRFNQIGGKQRNCLAALDTSGSATPWNPNACDLRLSRRVKSKNRKIASLESPPGVYTLALSGGTLYVGGRFDSIGGQTRINLAALDASGMATGWNPSAIASLDSRLMTLVVDGSTAYAGGYFSKIGEPDKTNFAPIHIQTGLVQQ